MKLASPPDVCGEILRKHCASHWLSGTEGIQADGKTIALVDTIEHCALERSALACCWFANSFSAQRELRICNQTVSTIPALFQALFNSPRDFYLAGGYESLMDRTEGVALYGFLYSFGYQKLIEMHWEKIESYNEFDKACVLFALLGAIASRIGENSALLLNFFLNYGPIGIATYTKSLAERTDPPVYRGLDTDASGSCRRSLTFVPAG